MTREQERALAVLCERWDGSIAWSLLPDGSLIACRRDVVPIMIDVDGAQREIKPESEPALAGE